MSHHPPVHALLLAAGFGRRLGYPKAALKLGGRWMLPEIVRNLKQGGAAQVTIVLSEAALDAIADLGLPDADFEVHNPDPDRGRTSSILLGLEKLAPDQALLIHPCDIPMLQASVVTRLLHAWGRLADPASHMARPISSGGRGGHPLLIGSKFLPELRSFRANQSLRDLIHGHRNSILDVKIADDPGPFLDVDTPEQLTLLESLLNKND